MVMKDSPTHTKMVEVFSAITPLKIKIPPATPIIKINIPKITVCGSTPIVNGVNIPDRSAAAAIM